MVEPGGIVPRRGGLRSGDCPAAGDSVAGSSVLTLNADADMVKTKLTVTVNVYVCSRGSNGTVPVSFSFTPAQSKLKLKANTVTVYRGETVVVPVTTTPSGAQLSSLYVSGTKPAGITVLPLADSKTVKITAASSVQPGTYSVILKGKAYGAATDSEYVALVLKIAVKK